MAEELAALRQTDGRPYRLIALPLPRPIRDVDGRRLPATYANFLIINGAVLLPVYGDPADGMAQARLAEAFPERQIVPIDCSALIRQFGSLHCVTMQLPAAVAVTARPSAAL
jgi:agmatine/peptidylarginine deiminase